MHVPACSSVWLHLDVFFLGSRVICTTGGRKEIERR